ncbi:MAG: histidinol-phosphate transaminase [Firmicutes bacterium]|nr:histidinol-phosphate transaminase [Bacillota bacterium]
MSKFLSKLALSLDPYVPGEQPKDKKYVKLNTNENPYPPSQMVQDAIASATSDLRLYPDPDATAVREAIAKYYNDALALQGDAVIDSDNVFIGNGSDEVLAFVFPTFFKGKKIAFADITYSFYPVYCALFEIPYQLIPLTEDFSYDMDAYTGAGDDIGGILLCNPNAPTGRALSLAEVETILDANRDKLVLVDEAYVDFGGETAVALVNRYDNLLVCQTLSKSRQLAGMRVGAAIACKEVIAGLNAVKNSFNSYTADRLGIAAAKAAFEDVAYFDETRNKIMATRERTVKALEAMGFDVIPSKANFVFAKPSGMPAAELFKKLRDDGILVRYFNKPRIDDRLRITIGTDEEMDAMLASARKILGK